MQPDGWVGKRVLVTGAAGYIGGRLCEHLQGRGAVPVPWTRRTVDLLDRTATITRMQEVRPDAVVHLAATLGGRTGANWVQPDNLLTALHVLEAVSAVQPSAFLHVGTLDEYGDGATPFAEAQAPRPLTPYAAGKAAAGLYWSMAGGIHIRLALVYGPGQDPRFFIPQLCDALRRGADFEMTAGEQVRDFIYVDDVVEGLVRLLGVAGGQVVNLCSGAGQSLKDVVSIAQKLAGTAGRVKLGALPYRPREVFLTVGSTEKLTALLGWCPATSIEPGLRRTWDAFNPDRYGI